MNELNEEREKQKKNKIVKREIQHRSKHNFREILIRIKLKHLIFSTLDTLPYRK